MKCKTCYGIGWGYDNGIFSKVSEGTYRCPDCDGTGKERKKGVKHGNK